MRLWWPQGYGSPSLYSLNVTLSVLGQQVDTISKKVGLRTVVLVQENAVKNDSTKGEQGRAGQGTGHRAVLRARGRARPSPAEHETQQRFKWRFKSFRRIPADIPVR